MKITNPITLDVARSNSYICLLGKQFDSNSRNLQVTLTNNGQPLPIPSGAGVVLRATRADGAGSMTAGTVNGDGTALVEIDEAVLEVAGAASLSIEVTSGGQVLTSASCNLTVQKADASGWVKVYVAAASVSAGTYHISLAGQSYSFTTTQTIPAGGAIYFNSDGGTAQTRDASGNVLDASLTLTAGTSGTELTSDVPTMSFLAAIAGRMATIEAEMSQKANIDGSYPLLNAGSADNLMTDNGATQAIPFIQEGTGKGNGEATVKAGRILQLKKKLGNTVGVNQLCTDETEGTSTVAGAVTKTVANHRISFSGTATNSQSNTYRRDIGVVSGHMYLLDVSASGTPAQGSSTWQIYASGSFASAYQISSPKILTVSSSGTGRLSCAVYVGTAISASFTEPRLIDLTLWFGSNDRIPSDLLSHPENWGRYYAGSLDYNAGTLVSADGTVLTSKGADGTTVLAEVDTGSEVLRSAGAVADEKTPDGTITRSVIDIDLSALNYNGATADGRTYSYGLTGIQTPSADSVVPNVRSAKYIPLTEAGWYAASTPGITITGNGYGSDGQIGIVDSALANMNSAQIQAALSGVHVYAELATPTTEQGTAFAENIPCDDFGSLMWTQTKGIPQGNEIFYPTDLKGDLESILTAIPSANGTYTLRATVTTAGVTFSWS